MATDGLNRDQHASFAVVINAAERVTFGDWTPTAREFGPVLTEGEALLSELDVEQGEPE